MNRAERRKQKVKRTEPVYNMTASQLEGMKIEITNEAICKAFALMVAFPTMVIHDKFDQLAELPDSLRDAEINIGVEMPKPEIRMEKGKDGSISLSACYDMCDISEFAWRVAKELNDDIEKALIEDLLELNGYIKERTCRNVAVEGVLFECSECGAKTVDAVGNYTQEYCAACGRRVQDAD